MNWFWQLNLQPSFTSLDWHYTNVQVLRFGSISDIDPSNFLKTTFQQLVWLMMPSLIRMRSPAIILSPQRLSQNWNFLLPSVFISRICFAKLSSRAAAPPNPSFMFFSKPSQTISFSNRLYMICLSELFGTTNGQIVFALGASSYMKLLEKSDPIDSQNDWLASTQVVLSSLSRL